MRAYTSRLRRDVRAPPTVAVIVAVWCLMVYRQSMAIYRLSAQVISKSEGRSATAAAAYRAGVLVVDRSTGVIHNYTRRAGVADSFLMAPTWAPEWALDRESLWNEVQAAEKRKDAQLCREVQIALPHELSEAQRAALLRAFVDRAFVAAGMVADVAIHSPDANGSELNHHAHIMLTMRAIGPDGFGLKCREWNDKELLVSWRVMWEQMANKALADAGMGVQIDCRSLAEQRADALAQGDLDRAEELDRLPAKKIGWKAMKALQFLRANPDAAPAALPARASAHLEIEQTNAEKAAAVADLATIRAKVREADEKSAAHLREGNSARLRQAGLAVLPITELEARIRALQPPTVESIFNTLAPIVEARQKLKTADHDALLARGRAHQAGQALAKASAAIDDWDRNRPIRKFLTHVGIFRDQTRENLIAERDKLSRQLQTLEQSQSVAEALQIAARTELAQIEADPALRQRAADMHAEKSAQAAPQIAELQKAIKARNAWAKVGKKYLTDSSEDSDQVSQNRPAPGSSNPHF